MNTMNYRAGLDSIYLSFAFQRGKEKKPKNLSVAKTMRELYEGNGQNANNKP